VVVHDLHIISVPIVPNEADAILIVDPDAVLSPAVARERLEPITRKRPQVAELSSGVQLLQLPLSDSRHLLQPSAELASEQRLGLGILERPNHSSTKV
jgi:hypothetical protein